MKALVFAACLIVSGCATQGTVLSDYLNIPDTCSALDREMVRLAGDDALASNINLGKGSVASGVAAAAAAGMLPTGFAWAPLVALALNSLVLKTHESRIAVIHARREKLNCPALVVEE